MRLVLPALLAAAVLLATQCSQPSQPAAAPATPAKSSAPKKPPPTQSATATPAPQHRSGTKTPRSEPATAQGEGDADVVAAHAVLQDDGRFRFEVTVRHADTGWDDFADGWDVVGPDGKVFKADPAATYTRVLVHPHVREQPFTRSQSNVPIDATVHRVTVRAHDRVHGFGGHTVSIDLDALRTAER